MWTGERALAAATSPGLPSAPTVLVPVGSTEQHGPHLPLDTDTVIAVEVAKGAADALTRRGHETFVAPAIAYGSSGEHQDFPGTSSIGTAVLRGVLVELTRSLSTWASRVIFVNAHGGNVTALRDAIDQLQHEGRHVAWVPCATEDVDLHAGRTETSLMLHLAPWNVRLSRAEAGNAGSLAELLPLMIEGGVKAVSPNGVLGDPAGATAAEGVALLESMVADVTIVVAAQS
ncbi:mycofactocin biosynthesis peptidyl-dipeptidase MftE [Nocardioides sp. SYSU DS0651]|uniref:mycofactocin biosynthesis peptidyl-dipeptidase MftE n=1 Tax=Nocardioides sp. SYSU DS0651 TaxID=3415955 RepID=UPI003F4C436E